MSSFAMSVPFPRDKMSLAASSSVEYFNEHISESMTLKPGGSNKSSMSRHFPGWDLFGITPKRLTWMLG